MQQDRCAALKWNNYNHNYNCCCWTSFLSPNRVQGLSSYWDERPFGHNRHGPKSGGAAVSLSVRAPAPHLTQCRLGRVLPLYQVAPWSIQLCQPCGHNTPTIQTHRTMVPYIRRTITCNVMVTQKSLNGTQICTQTPTKLLHTHSTD